MSAPEINGEKSVSIRFCGFGGQGVILSAVILGEALVLRRGLYAAQTQSYGSEARGGQCQSELIISDNPILTPVRARNDVLVALFQTAFNTYAHLLADDGILFVDSGMVTDFSALSSLKGRPTVYPVPAAESALALGGKIAANMVMLGFFSGVTGAAGFDDLDRALQDNVKESFLEINRQALRVGFELAEKADGKTEAGR